MPAITLFLHVVISILLVVVVLLQSSKGGGLAGAFGGDSMGAAFGGRGVATFLSKLTTILAILFVFSCFVQVFISKGKFGGPQSIIQQDISQQQTATPASNLPLPTAGSDVLPGTVTQPPDTSK
jgi:preprotein translocase subunit SecG